MKDNKATIFVEQAQIIEHHAHAQGQYILRLKAPRCAATAVPGQFVLIQCSNEPHSSTMLMRRPYSILSVSEREAWIELLYKTVGKGSKMLAQAKAGDRLSCMGPIGSGFAVHTKKCKPLLMGGGVGMPPILFLAQYLKQNLPVFKPVVLLGSENPFPFPQTTSKHTVSGISSTAALSCLEAQDIPSRLCTQQSYANCFNGRIDELAVAWLDTLNQDELGKLEIFACGPAGMLKSCTEIARDYNIPCQICVEEYMACGVGGCAGCTIPLMEDGKTTMKRVCVDGPVFDGMAVYP